MFAFPALSGCPSAGCHHPWLSSRCVCELPCIGRLRNLVGKGKEEGRGRRCGGRSPDRKGLAEGRSRGCWELESRLPAVLSFFHPSVFRVSPGEIKTCGDRLPGFFLGLPYLRHTISPSFLPSWLLLISRILADVRCNDGYWQTGYLLPLPRRAFVAWSVSEDKTSFRRITE